MQQMSLYNVAHHPVEMIVSNSGVFLNGGENTENQADQHGHEPAEISDFKMETKNTNYINHVRVILRRVHFYFHRLDLLYFPRLH